MPNVGGQPQRSTMKPKTIPINSGKQLAPIRLRFALPSIIRIIIFWSYLFVVKQIESLYGRTGYVSSTC